MKAAAAAKEQDSGVPAASIKWVPRGSLQLPGAYQVRQWDRAEVILKVSERCHLNCSYCYFFNGGDDSYLRHAPLIDAQTVEDVGRFLARTAAESGVKSMQIDLHGGEPTLMKKHRFDAMCAVLRREIGAVTRLEIALQTSGTLLDDEWISILAKHDIHVGVSIDGPREFHDAFRLDHKGRGTYDDAVAGLRLLQAAHARGQMKFAPGIICVANPSNDGRKTLNHLVDELGVKGLHFVFPLRSWDEHDPVELDAFVHYMVDMFDAWVERGDRSVNVRYLDSFFSLLLGGQKRIDLYEETLARNIAMTITSNGEVVGADDERVATYAFDNGFMASEARTVSQVMGTVPMQRYLGELAQRSDECARCCWGKVCKGGVPLAGATQRYSSANAFANRSVFCAGIKALLLRMTRHAMSKGVPFERIAEVLVC